MSTVDNLIAFRILQLLVTPFEKTKAFEYGIIDDKGKALKKVKDLSSTEKESYTALHRLVFNLKKLLAKVPGGSSKLASFVAAYWLIKENLDSKYVSINQEELNETIELMESKEIMLVEEELIVRKFLEEDGVAAAGVISNVTGPAVATDYPTIKGNKKPKVMKRKDVKLS